MGVTLQRIRHELKFRNPVVKEIVDINPNMRRIILTGEDLKDFVSQSPADHIKLFFTTENGEVMRDYTPRAFDNENGELTIDFALHEKGIATAWARNAKIGDSLKMGGPRGSLVVVGKPDWWLLIGDETAIPSIARRLEELGDDEFVKAIIAVQDESERIEFDTRANLDVSWIIRPDVLKTNGSPYIDTIKSQQFANNDGYIWIATEAHAARQIRDYFLTECQYPPHAISAKGYWVRGEMGISENF